MKIYETLLYNIKNKLQQNDGMSVSELEKRANSNSKFGKN